MSVKKVTTAMIKGIHAICSNCGIEIIHPDAGINYGSVRNLRRDGFTGDIDPPTMKAYCFNCMRKLGWFWGQKETEEKDEE